MKVCACEGCFFKRVDDTFSRVRPHSAATCCPAYEVQSREQSRDDVAETKDALKQVRNLTSLKNIRRACEGTVRLVAQLDEKAHRNAQAVGAEVTKFPSYSAFAGLKATKPNHLEVACTRNSATRGAVVQHAAPLSADRLSRADAACRLKKSGPTVGAQLLVLAALLPMLGGCLPGPDFERPSPIADSRYGERPDPQRFVAPGTGATQTIVPGGDLPAQWSSLFRSPRLDALVQRGLAASPTILQAEASLRAAQAAIDLSRAALYPAATAGLTRTGGGTIDNAASIYGLYGASVGVSYTIDVFGGIRRGIEVQSANAEAAAFALRAAHLALTANIISAAIQEASLGQQIVLAQEILQQYRDQLQSVKQRSEAGADAVTSVLTQESLIRSQEAALFALRGARDVARHRLAVLTGSAPSTYDDAAFTLAALPVPTRLPVRLPAALADQRPDVRIAEAQFHAASATVGVATAAQLPTFTLSANLGANAVNLAGLAASSAWTTGAGLAQPLLIGGALEAERQSAIAAYDAARANYRSTLLTALQNVADALTSLDTDAKVLVATTQAEDLARRSLASSEVEYRAGAIKYADLLTAQAIYAGAAGARVRSQAQRLTDTVALFQVLGGGWSGA